MKRQFYNYIISFPILMQISAWIRNIRRRHLYWYHLSLTNFSWNVCGYDFLSSVKCMLNSRDLFVVVKKLNMWIVLNPMFTRYLVHLNAFQRICRLPFEIIHIVNFLMTMKKLFISFYSFWRKLLERYYENYNFIINFLSIEICMYKCFKLINARYFMGNHFFVFFLIHITYLDYNTNILNIKHYSK